MDEWTNEQTNTQTNEQMLYNVLNDLSIKQRSQAVDQQVALTG